MVFVFVSYVFVGRCWRVKAFCFSFTTSWMVLMMKANFPLSFESEIGTPTLLLLHLHH